MATVKDLQRALVALKYDIGKVDGLIGPRTLDAALDAVSALNGYRAVPADIPLPSHASNWLLPTDWLPFCRMERVIVHWTADADGVQEADLEHYHIIVTRDGTPHRGRKSIQDNVSTKDGVYAAHTLNCNAGSIGFALDGMAGAVESPFYPGLVPITKTQWDVMPRMLAQICHAYSIPVTRETVLSHAEVQQTLGIQQRGKWDISRLPWTQSVIGARQIGDSFRAEVSRILGH